MGQSRTPQPRRGARSRGRARVTGPGTPAVPPRTWGYPNPEAHGWERCSLPCGAARCPGAANPSAPFRPPSRSSPSPDGSRSPRIPPGTDGFPPRVAAARSAPRGSRCVPGSSIPARRRRRRRRSPEPRASARPAVAPGLCVPAVPPPPPAPRPAQGVWEEIGCFAPQTWGVEGVKGGQEVLGLSAWDRRCL